MYIIHVPLYRFWQNLSTFNDNEEIFFLSRGERERERVKESVHKNISENK